MLPGYNHNIRYKELVFHVQTEDIGLEAKDMLTQVFLGGQIIAIERTSYEDLLGEGHEKEARDQRIKARMQAQHKKLLKSLVDGDYDSRLETLSRPHTPAVEAQPEELNTAPPRSEEAQLVQPIAVPVSESQPNVASAEDFAELDAAIAAVRSLPAELLSAALLGPTDVLFPENPVPARAAAAAATPAPEAPTPLPQLKPLPSSRSSSSKELSPHFHSLLTEDLEITPDRTPSRGTPPARGQETMVVRTRSQSDVAKKPLTAPPAPAGVQVDKMADARKTAETLVDFEVPATVRKKIDRPSIPPQETPTPVPTLVPGPRTPNRNRSIDAQITDLNPPSSRMQRGDENPTAPPSGPRRPVPSSSQPDTVMLNKSDIEAELRRRSASSASNVKPSVPPPPRGKSDSNVRPELLVVERSLDDVIMNYLQDDMD